MRSKDTEFAAIKLPRCLVGGGAKVEWSGHMSAVWWNGGAFDESVRHNTRNPRVHNLTDSSSTHRRARGSRVKEQRHGRLQHFHQLDQHHQRRARTSIHQSKAWIQKTAERRFFLRHDISKRVGKGIAGFFRWFFCLLNSLKPKKRCFSTQEFTRFLSMVSSQRRATRSDVSFQTK